MRGSHFALIFDEHFAMLSPDIDSYKPTQMRLDVL